VAKASQGFILRGIGIIVGLIVVYISIDVLAKVWLIIAVID
jgi:hypothetical protein